MFTYPVTQIAPGPAGSAFPVADQLLGLWDAEEGLTGSNPVTVWADQSGSGNDWLEDTGSGGTGPSVVAATLNGLAVINFDGLTDKMSQAPFISGSSAGSMACVVRRTTTSNKGWHVFGTSSTQPHFMHGNLIYETFGSSTRTSGIASSAFDLNEWGVYTVTKLSGFSNLTRYANNVQFAQQGTTASWYTTFRLGSGNLGGAVGATSGWQGQIAEMAVWDKELSTQDRADVFDYFNAKFALGL